MHSNPNILCPIHFQKGLLSIEDINDIQNGSFHILVLNDLMEKIAQSEDMRDLFSMHCHHKNITAIMVSQNPFLKGKHSHTISINTHIHILFRNKRDESSNKYFSTSFLLKT